MVGSFSLGRPQVPEYDVVVIGGGPGGLTAAMYTARAKLKTLVLDRAPSAGALGVTSKIENYPGVPGSPSGQELLDIMRRQAQSFGAEYLQSQVLHLDAEADPKVVTASTGTYHARSVIIATGSMGRKPTIRGEAELLGRGVSYCATCDAAFFEGQDVAVVGDNEEAFEEAMVLSRHARHVYLLAPLAKVRASEEAQETVRAAENVYVRPQHKVMAINGDGGVGSVTVRTPEGDQEIPVQGVFIYLQGAQPIVDFLSGVEITPTGCVKVNKETMETSVPGVYAIGDVTCKEVRQAVVAAAEGTMAALQAEKYLNKRQKVRAAW